MSWWQRVVTAWQALKGKIPSAPVAEEERLELRRQLAEERLRLQETQKQLSHCKAELASVQRTQAEQVRERTATHLEALFRQLAAPLAQLKLQQALAANGKELAARDVLILAQQFANAVEAAGLEPIGGVGERCAFDPEWAQALAPGVSLQAGEQVVVRFVGYRFQGQVLRKALVERSA